MADEQDVAWWPSRDDGLLHAVPQGLTDLHAQAACGITANDRLDVLGRERCTDCVERVAKRSKRTAAAEVPTIRELIRRRLIEELEPVRSSPGETEWQQAVDQYLDAIDPVLAGALVSIPDARSLADVLKLRRALVIVLVDQDPEHAQRFSLGGGHSMAVTGGVSFTSHGEGMHEIGAAACELIAEQLGAQGTDMRPADGSRDEGPVH